MRLTQRFETIARWGMYNRIRDLLCSENAWNLDSVGLSLRVSRPFPSNFFR